ncbi:hypothetical protein QLQ12_27280 [Actinoplanes sp. NEAU-A12]|uniref:Ig-like domain-containing protein n=1 Tax=Actinoplanes sandaracinus TaxID=3045177 RepID=A0ABT6WRF7_9ACTN|nr:hypothetical protein [Actinoplanes sandaracinus]MDI6102326.1 hypothetical protein [Actinoplanes sandaracinus]
MHSRIAIRVAAAVGATAAILIPQASAAQAAQVESATAVAAVTTAPYAASPAPTCIKKTPGKTGGTPNGAKVTLTNTCGSAKRLKVVWTHARDSDCFTLNNGATKVRSSPVALPFSHYDKTVTC